MVWEKHLESCEVRVVGFFKAAALWHRFCAEVEGKWHGTIPTGTEL
jgi:hypothetical protein